ncbi:MAG: GNAT family N-acetyltransferase [Patescibacteria group bacterium]|jgi:predicted N-acetyltransferase YhbS
MQFRFYTEQDYETVAGFFKQSGQYDPTWDTAENLKEKITRFPTSIIVCIEGGEVVASVFTMEDGWGTFIYRLVVRPDMQKQGIGRALMAFAEMTLKQKGKKEVAIFVHDTRQDLLEWYADQGYLFDDPKSYRSLFKKL